MKLTYFLLFLMIGFTNAQTHRFFYELKFKQDSTQTEPLKSFMVLDINPDGSKYYDNVFLEKDSINKANNDKNTNWTKHTPVTRKKNSNENLNFSAIDFQIYSYPTEDLIKWNLSNETKQLAGFTVQKATTNFGGRKWTAWFTKEIPFSEGPYKFRGLPGLIVSIEDSQKQYSFNLIKSKKLGETYDTSNFLEVRYGRKPILITEKIFLKKAMEFYNDPMHEDRENLRNGSSESIDIDGKRYTKASELVPLIKDEQNYIRKYNNPIERNKAIKYPVK